MRNVQPPAVKERTREVLSSDATPTAQRRACAACRLSSRVLSARGTWREPARSLIDFLRLPRTAQVEAHARYYLGQTYYFQERARDALMEFILSEDYYYPEVQSWKDACFEKLAVTDN